MDLSLNQRDTDGGTSSASDEVEMYIVVPLQECPHLSQVYRLFTSYEFCEAHEGFISSVTA